jgi:hypothetical protein
VQELEEKEEKGEENKRRKGEKEKRRKREMAGFDLHNFISCAAHCIPGGKKIKEKEKERRARTLSNSFFPSFFFRFFVAFGDSHQTLDRSR